MTQLSGSRMTQKLKRHEKSSGYCLCVICCYYFILFYTNMEEKIRSMCGQRDIRVSTAIRGLVDCNSTPVHQSYSYKTNISDWISPCESSFPSVRCHISQYGLFVFQGSFQRLPHGIVRHPRSNQIGFALCRGISSTLSNSSLS